MKYPERAAAVREFLQKAYPGDRVEGRYDAGREAHIFDVSGRDGPHRVIVEEGFLAANEVAGIPSRLTAFTLVEHLRDLGDTPLRVTHEGLKLEYE